MNEQELKAERLRILDDTATFYNSNNRALIGRACCYISPDGKQRCSIGRNVTEKEARLMQANNSSIEHIWAYIPKAIPQKLIDVGIDFLAQLQDLHDCEDYWTSNGLSLMGINKYHLIKKTFC